MSNNSGYGNNAQTHKRNFRAMGTDVLIEIIADKADMAAEAQRVSAESENIFRKNEKIFSRFDPKSELAEINNNLGAEIAVSREMLAVLQLCLKFNKISNGYFDPRVIGNLEKIGYDKDFTLVAELRGEGTQLEKIVGDLADDLKIYGDKVLIKKRIDTTGIAKGFTVDEAADYLEKEGCKNFVVDAGGDMFARGLDQNSQAWKIGIEGLEENKIQLKLQDEGIATSGISRKRWTRGGKKFHHLINPKDPENFSFDIKTVTVIAEKTVEADGRAKVLVLLGQEKGLEFANRNKIKALWLDYRGNVYLSEAMKDNLA